MKKSLFVVAVACLMVLATGAVGVAAPGAASAPLSVTAVIPSSAPNDLHSAITICGTGFATNASGTVPPAVSLGATLLTNVVFVSETTLTATVPWGMNPGTYALTVTNPGGGSASLVSAFTVAQGIGLWNSGDLFGGIIAQLLMKPGDPNTLYALAYDVGLFRTRDAGEHWTYIVSNVTGNADFVLDPLHPTWLYCYRYGQTEGLFRSKDEGNTWALVPDAWTTEDSGMREVFVSPHDPNTLFECSYPFYGGRVGQGVTNGLKKSVDGGAHWTSVSSLPVQSVAFHPSDPSQMVLATSDARVYRSTNGGGTWNQAATPSASVTSLGMGGFITYNPHKSAEVWFSSVDNPGGIYKSANGTLSSWQHVVPLYETAMAYDLTFVAADTVYMHGAYSINGGGTWLPYGPTPWYGQGQVLFPLDTTQTAYISDDDAGVRKTTDGGVTWPEKNQGLSGLKINSLEVSRFDPLCVYATFDGPLGIFRSTDGTNHWAYIPLDDSFNARQVLEDPFDPAHVYAVMDAGLYETTNACETWTDLGWGVPPSAPGQSLNSLALDPYHEGHLLGAMYLGNYGEGPGYLYDSTDGGKTWQGPVVMPQAISRIQTVVFDPETTGTVYLGTDGTGVYKSANSGASWKRVGASHADMLQVNAITIATHPQHVVMTQMPEDALHRSLDGGITWRAAAGAIDSPDNPNPCAFANGDSTRLYGGTAAGLYFSGNLGDSWTAAAGTLGKVPISAINAGFTDGHPLIYAATKGGDAGTVGGSAVAAGGRAVAASSASTLVKAGVYRRAQTTQTKTFRSSGYRDGWVLETRERSSVGGAKNSGSTTLRLGDSATRKQYRSVLSFSTSSIPNNAVITKVTLRVRKRGVAGGGNPVTKFGGFVADVKKGYFGTSVSLQASDFQKAASKSRGPYTLSTSGGWYNISLTGAKAYVNKYSSRAGRTQVRLRFKRGDNNNAVANYLKLYSGNASASSRPQLVVTYYVP